MDKLGILTWLIVKVLFGVAVALGLAYGISIVIQYAIENYNLVLSFGG
jgi:hypothetical protein